MEERRLYYVTMETGEVHREPFDRKVKYYEILATVDDVMKFEELYNKLDKTEYDPVPILIKPLGEKDARETRSEQQCLWDEIYTMIYELGTEKTKMQIKDMNGVTSSR